MSKRQRNHKVKVYFEEYFKTRGISPDADGYKQLGQIEPQGKREYHKFRKEFGKVTQMYFETYNEWPSKKLLKSIMRDSKLY